MLGQPLGLPNPASSDEVVEGRPWWKMCCLGCCLGFIVLVIGTFFVIRFMWGSAPERVSRLPDSFPSQLVLFRPEQATEILYYAGKKKGGAAAIVTAPLEWIGNLFGNEQATTGSVRVVSGAINSQIKKIEQRDSVSIQWKNLNASRDEVLRFYAGALRQLGIGNPQLTNPEGTWDVHLTGANSIYSFSLLMDDDPDKAGIDNMSIVVEYPVEE